VDFLGQWQVTIRLRTKDSHLKLYSINESMERKSLTINISPLPSSFNGDAMSFTFSVKKEF
jgi:hypothetical protein